MKISLIVNISDRNFKKLKEEAIKQEERDEIINTALELYFMMKEENK